MEKARRPWSMGSRLSLTTLPAVPKINCGVSPPGCKERKSYNLLSHTSHGKILWECSMCHWSGKRMVYADNQTLVWIPDPASESGLAKSPSWEMRRCIAQIPLHRRIWVSWPFLGQPHLVTGPGISSKTWSFQPNMRQFWWASPPQFGQDFVGPMSQLDFPLCPVLYMSPSFHRCWSLINVCTPNSSILENPPNSTSQSHMIVYSRSRVGFLQDFE